MTSKTISAILAGAAALSLALGSSAAHAASDSAEARARVLRALTLTNNSALDFGAIVAAAGAGTVAISAAGARACGGSLTCSGSVSAAVFDISGGTSGEIVTINADPSVTLTSGANSMTATLVESTTSATLNASGAASFSVGGTLSVAANQAEGVYVGNFDVTADYQ